jgi:hypothetical protein
MSDGRGVPYLSGSPARCQFITDNARYAQRICNDAPAWRGAPWCECHLDLVIPSKAAARRRLLAEAA